MQTEDYFKDKPHIKMDRYFIDKRDKKPMCKLCGPHYMNRQFFESLPADQEPYDDKFLEYIEANFERVMLEQ
jgi:hypothetical protein